MHQPGVEVRPLRELTGRAMFNEVFMSEARVSVDAIIGDVNNGWAAANTTLAHERASLGSGGGDGGYGAAMPGTVAGFLDRRAGDFAPKSDAAQAVRRSGRGGARGGSAKLLIDLAKGNGTITDASLRQGLMKLYTLGEIGRINGLRLKAEKEAGRDIAGMGNISKLSMSEMMRLTRDLGLRIVGPGGTLHAYDPESRKALDEATGNPFLGMVTEMALFAQAPPIYGGTDQVQRNIIGERVLGLPKEPNDDKVKPFSELPKNA
jgi:alkylation response protein AidB-like acyl-CoA dehydrogenase